MVPGSQLLKPMEFPEIRAKKKKKKKKESVFCYVNEVGFGKLKGQLRMGD